ncbi:hypothetical protein JMN32_11820 [Fulvivirga sp. 29W222]|uniref:Uncharacterized protein n=1 Tax=Fulvivirga marina TaxID=2494733 RepID=A0A937KBJ6_9BACT|nr:hypothetical protein [Fulvivirga marina]MBL6447001.1 hypothetical protein [Fulvivirga marina]
MNNIARYISMLRRLFFLRAILVVALLMAQSPLYSQQEEQSPSLEELYSELDSLFANETIPDELFNLVDSLLTLDSAKYSSLNLRLGYVSNIVSAGRNFGFDQYGFSPGIAYYHHSGIFTGITGYFSNEYNPGYYLNTFNFGYIHTLGEKWVLSVAHDFYLFNDSIEYHSFDKVAQASIYFQKKWADVGADYALLYGNDKAHRLTVRANGRLKIKTLGFINSITFMPGASFQWGNANVFYLRQPRTAATDLNQIVQENNYPKLEYGGYRRLVYLLESDRQLAAASYLRERGYTRDQIEHTIASYYNGEFTVEDTFGFMNYSFSLPVSITAGKWNLLLNYAYNLPVALPGEEIEYSANGYFSTTLSYLIYWQKK